MQSGVVRPEATLPDTRRWPHVGEMRRFAEIATTLVKYGFVDVVDALHLTPYLAAGRRVWSALGGQRHPATDGIFFFIKIKPVNQPEIHHV